MTAALAVHDLRVHTAAGVPLLRGVSMQVRPGVPLTILGETGSGKTLVVEAAMGTLAPELTAAGRITVGELEADAGDRAARRHLWGREIALLPQEPWLALDPTMRAGRQVEESHRFVRGKGRAEAAASTSMDLGALALDPAARRAYPHQLSGGMAQRVAIAAARAGGATLLLADEPTKGLDADRRDAVAALLRTALDAGGALLCITHDAALARALGGDVAVMLDGAVIEQGPAERVLTAPTHAYTSRLLAADPARWPWQAAAPTGDEVLAADGVAVTLGGRRVLSGIDLSIAAGEWLSVTGPSGCGKTTLGNALLGLRPLDAGQVRRKPGVARSRYQKLYQDPVATFAPHLSLRTAMGEAAALHRTPWSRLSALLRQLRVADGLLDRRPDQVSGGELQRIAVARALLPDPVFLFADEPTSRLDPVTQQDTMATLREVTAERGCAVLLVTHDTSLASKMSTHGRSLVLP